MSDTRRPRRSTTPRMEALDERVVPSFVLPRAIGGGGVTIPVPGGNGGAYNLTGVGPGSAIARQVTLGQHQTTPHAVSPVPVNHFPHPGGYNIVINGAGSKIARFVLHR